jgi:hypothetical protein
VTWWRPTNQAAVAIKATALVPALSATTRPMAGAASSMS